MAYCLRTKGDYEGADKAYAKAIAKEPKNENWYINWASSKIEEGDTAQAAVIYEKMFDKVQLEGAPLYFAYAQFYHAT